ncbi:MAG: phosphotransferase [Steroidobacter sp.]
MSPAEAAASALKISRDDVVAVESIKHGLTNESWLVRTRAAVVVVRMGAANESALRIDRASETRVLAAVAAAGIGAPVLQCDPARHLLVTRYLGPPWSQQDAQSVINIRRLADVLRRLHRIDTPPGVRTVDLGATVAGYLGTLDLHGASSNLTGPTLRTRARIAAESLRRDSAPCLCHNDVHHLNVVDGGELRLIDWEYAGTGEPLFDLASVCVYHRYDRAQRELLLSEYSRGAPASATRLELALWLFEYIRDLWTAVRSLRDG